MRIFALETDIEKIKARFCGNGECVLHTTPFHTFSFFFASLRDILVTVVIFAAGTGAVTFGVPMAWTIGICALLWFIFVSFNLLKAYIDWLYDCVIITSDQVILVDQTSIFKHEIRPIHVDNIGAITTSTQFWDLFPFGIVKIHLKEGLGGDTIVLRYVPRAGEVAAIITGAVTEHQRRKHGDTGQQ